MSPILRRATEHLAEFLSENRLLPKFLLRHRQVKRNRFLRSLGIRGGIGAEIGVQKGFFSHTILNTLKPERLHLIDPWHLLGEEWEWASGNKSTRKALDNVRHWFKREMDSGRIVLHVGFDEDELEKLPDHYFDWVYLDTSHEYEHTRRELDLLDRKVKPGGMILGDDWFPDPEHLFYGQYRAIDEFAKRTGYPFAYASDRDHQWALRKDASHEREAS